MAEGYSFDRPHDDDLILQVNTFVVRNLRCLGIERADLEASAYFFDDPQDNVKGIIGLDFLADTEICLNFRQNPITVR